MRRTSPTLLILLSSLFASMNLSASEMPESAETSTSAGDPDAVVPVDEYFPQIVEGMHLFGTSLAKPLSNAALREGKNFFFSPYSIGTAWTMASLGGSDSVRSEMFSAFGGQFDLKPEYIQEGNAALRQLLLNHSSGSLQIANAIWVNKDISLVDAYQKELQKSFGAEVANLDFSAPGAVTQINKYVSDHTAGMIPKLLDRTDPSALTYLINTVALKVKWEKKFDKALTKEQSFTSADGSSGQVQMMRQKGQFTYMRSRTIEGVSLDTVGGEFAIELFLPVTARTPEELSDLADLSALQWWEDQFADNKKGELFLPRLKLDYSADLIPAIKGLGIQKPFRPGENFSRMVNGPSAISLILHKATLELDEEGASAAAATGAAMTRSIVLRDDSFTLKFDRPFLVAIRHKVSRSILFFGIVNNPQQQ